MWLFRITVVALLLYSSWGHALDVLIDNAHFYPGELQKKVILNNDGDGMIALKVIVAHRRYNETGVENTKEPYSGIIVLPSLVVVGPGEEQIVNLRLTESFPRDKEIPLRLIVSTVPVNLNNKKVADNPSSGGVQMVYQLARALYLTPNNAQANVILESLESEGSDLRLALKNNGTAHKIFYELPIKLDNGFIFTINTEQLRGGINLLPGERRLINVKRPSDWPQNAWISAKLISKDKG